jgi:hypothetical protein
MPYITLDFRSLLSIAVIECSHTIVNRSAINKYPIADILPFISIDIVFGLLSNVRLHGMDNILHANASLRLYLQFTLRKVCNILLKQFKPLSLQYSILKLLWEYIHTVYHVSFVQQAMVCNLLDTEC